MVSTSNGQDHITVSVQDLRQTNEKGFRDQYKVGKVIGKGAFGEVRLITHRVSGNIRAVKILKKTNLDEGEKERILNEINILKAIDHPGIVNMYEFFEDSSRFYLV